MLINLLYLRVKKCRRRVRLKDTKIRLTRVDNLYIRLSDFIYNCSKVNTEFYIAKYMMENLKKFPDITIQEVAEESFTSTTSVTKFCHKIGYQNFYELRNAIGPRVVDESIFCQPLKRMDADSRKGIKEFLVKAQKLDERIFDSFDYSQLAKLGE